MSYREEQLSNENPADFYSSLNAMLDALLSTEKDGLAQLCNAAALLGHQLQDTNWVGFYLLKQGELVVGPFQGKPACTRIKLGRGVCGTSAQKNETIVVADVEEFPGHIACDAASASEIVVPLRKNGSVIGVLDIDSPRKARFSHDDKSGIEVLAQTLSDRVNWDAVVPT